MLWRTIALSIVMTTYLPTAPQAPRDLSAGVTACQSTFDVAPVMIVCIVTDDGEDCSARGEYLDPVLIASSHLIFFGYSSRMPWCAAPYLVTVRYMRSTSGRYMAEIEAKPLTDGIVYNVRGWGSDPRDALVAAHRHALDIDVSIP